MLRSEKIHVTVIDLTIEKFYVAPGDSNISNSLICRKCKGKESNENTASEEGGRRVTHSYYSWDL